MHYFWVPLRVFFMYFRNIAYRVIVCLIACQVDSIVVSVICACRVWHKKAVKHEEDQLIYLNVLKNTSREI